MSNTDVTFKEANKILNKNVRRLVIDCQYMEYYCNDKEIITKTQPLIPLLKDLLNYLENKI